MNIRYKIKSNLPGIFITLSALLFSLSASASAAETLFNSEGIIRIELRSDFSAIEEERTGTPVYHDGELTYRQKGGKPVTIPVRVMARGNFRLNPANCSFSPLLLDFKKGDVKNTLFENQNKLKLVTPCQTEEDVIDEYTIYKMYNQVTDRSLKVRLANISYIDEGTHKKLFEKYSFFLEDKDQAAERNNAVIKKDTVNHWELNREGYLKLALFQYIIGNMDWHVTLGKNLEVMKQKDLSGELFAVPYDFDFSAFVNAEYTNRQGVPVDILVERRRYLGSCFTAEELGEVFDFYRELRPLFTSIIREQKLITLEDRKGILDFVDKFYSIIDNRDLVAEEFMSGCE
ncbi:MAG: hypothetical protein V1903_01240 [Bacteroidota bacterium]